MSKSEPYWLGKRPLDGKRWAYTTSAVVLDAGDYHEKLFRMFRRYTKQWNDIELNMDRDLSEHTHEIHGAHIVGGAGRNFTLHWHNDKEDHWILEIHYARGFSEYYPELSCARNPFRSVDDIRSAHLHSKGNGQDKFEKWLELEEKENKENGEWDEYKA
ncbi:hypothetical protein ThidrDRAFT_3847 [Thiorhodococcus drewsii AZ1]|uniref:Uncharacterized protein n=1 Tax=Thiorhodococcus drewsii AZ1 TaxID=765913 RepID=G2E6F3_9GAMM|nr:hypothetical protein [Thiorhodococcus drewsii]EGV28314.1 hypothetical protein ThidrDRAFT_3847 [Thiorhodococcus drewsii AZ1]